ncbi:MAG: helix-turn-helix transcriptional regulator [Agathobacter sp.]|nr:helix-turn-helix transcriptional regulator [Agathobacter sp.]
MFSENLKAIRKSKGYTQEELAIKINVVRQTVSKWEKGLSVPDADVLSKIADVLEVSVSELLGAEIKETQNKNEIAEQLAKISEQLAIKNNRSRKIWKTIGICLMLIIVVPVIVSILGMTMYSVNKDSNTVGEEYVEEEYVEVIETEDIGEFE